MEPSSGKGMMTQEEDVPKGFDAPTAARIQPAREKINIKEDVQKLIIAYSNGQSSSSLNKAQLTQLIKDLMMTIKKAINEQQISAVFTNLDTNDDALISDEELMRIIADNKI